MNAVSHCGQKSVPDNPKPESHVGSGNRILVLTAEAFLQPYFYLILIIQKCGGRGKYGWVEHIYYSLSNVIGPRDFTCILVMLEIFHSGCILIMG